MPDSGTYLLESAVQNILWQPLKTVLAAGAGVITIILGLAVIALVVIVLGVETTWFSGQVQNRLEEKWNREVDWSGGIEVDWSLTPTVTIDQPTIENAPFPGPKKPHRPSPVNLGTHRSFPVAET